MVKGPGILLVYRAHFRCLPGKQSWDKVFLELNFRTLDQAYSVIPRPLSLDEGTKLLLPN